MNVAYYAYRYYDSGLSLETDNVFNPPINCTSAWNRVDDIPVPISRFNCVLKCKKQYNTTRRQRSFLVLRDSGSGCGVVPPLQKKKNHTSLYIVTVHLNRSQIIKDRPYIVVQCIFCRDTGTTVRLGWSY